MTTVEARKQKGQEKSEQKKKFIWDESITAHEKRR
jgi:hypothetical protein